jgi:hypothetical protein
MIAWNSLNNNVKPFNVNIGDMTSNDPGNVAFVVY